MHPSKKIQFHISQEAIKCFESKYSLDYLRLKENDQTIDLIKSENKEFYYLNAQIELKWGQAYTIDLNEFTEPILFEIETRELGLLVSINKAPYCFYITSNVEASDFEKIVNYQTLRILDLRNAKNVGLTNLALFASLNQLTHLNLHNCTTLEDISGLAALSQLEILSIAGCKVVTDGKQFAQLTNLVELNISNCRSILSLEGIENLQKLEKVNISYCTSITDLQTLALLPQLKRLDIQGCYQLPNNSTHCLPKEVKVIKTTSILEKCTGEPQEPSDETHTEEEWLQLIFQSPSKASYLPKEFYNKKEFMRTLLANCAEAFPYLNYLQS